MKNLKAGRSPAESLVLDIKSQILKKMLLPGDRIISERDIEVKYKMSRTAVRRAIKQLILQSWLCRKGKKGTFVETKFPSTKASRKIISFAYLPSLHGFNLTNSPHIDEMYNGLDKEVSKRGYKLHMVLGDQVKRQIFNISPGRCDFNGVIIGGIHTQENTLLLQNKGVPVVAIDCPVTGQKLNAVFPDRYSGGKLAADYFIKRGCREIVFVSSVYYGKKDIQLGAQRLLAGIKGRLREISKKISVRTCFPTILSPEAVEKNSLAELTAFLQRIDKGFGIMVADHALLGEIIHLIALNRPKAAERPIIVGYGTTSTNVVSNIPVAMLRADYCFMGQVACRRLIDLIEYGETQSLCQLVPVVLDMEDL